jgi:NADPH-dependent ferric siderophore reductase
VTEAPDIVRVRHEAKRRELRVSRIERLAPSMLRVVLKGAELAGFTSLGFDDHVKLFFPAGEGGAAGAAAMRDFTPRRYDAGAGELWIDFFLHEAGPAASWAAQAEPGQALSVGGPRGSFVIPVAGIDSHVLIGDETALPAIGRRLEELPARSRALVVLDVAAGAEAYPLASRAQLEVLKVPRSAQPDSAADRIIHLLRTVALPAEPCFTWVAAESPVARGLRRYLTAERGIDKRWVKAAGYWRRGAVGEHERISDED